MQSIAYSDTGEYDDGPDTDECPAPADECVAFEYAAGYPVITSINRGAIAFYDPALRVAAIEHIRRYHPEPARDATD